ncbi:MAG TPA: hypothetical protein VN258_03460 [Mobilitalea sp.]|nr:hypothetical protein [Mobilitalea sp.]
MVQAYNLMLESIPINRNTKYPVSKRSDLKKVYADIVNLSKRSPFYKINLTKENQEYTIGVKEAALALKAKITEMSDPEVSGFLSKSVAISDEKTLSARLLNADTDTLPPQIEFDIKSLAEGQVNRGRELLLTSKGLPIGEYNFTARVGDETYTLTYNQETRTENQETLKNMADFLNQSVPGIVASVEKGKTKDYGILKIASDMTGRFGDKIFLFEDEDLHSDGIVDFFGMNRMDKPAGLAQFSLNGIDKQTATNTFNLENTLRITLLQSSDHPVSLKIVSDSQKILSAVDSVLTTYNNLIKLAKDRTLDSQEHYKAAKLIGEMKNLEEAYQDELSACGFTAQEDGTMKLEDSLAVQAAEDGGMESLFNRQNGFIAKLLNKAETIAINPMEYLDKTIVTYPNSEKALFRNPYVTSMYSGLFFNSYC